uniref:30S ribosomal protein S15 n=1 Tax=Rosistilla oblonga TaxID=2527990 RepID=UPI003A96D5F8
MTITIERKAELIEEHKHSPGDNGTSEGQIRVLTQRINGLADHMRAQKKEYGT